MCLGSDALPGDGNLFDRRIPQRTPRFLAQLRQTRLVRLRFGSGHRNARTRQQQRRIERDHAARGVGLLAGVGTGKPDLLLTRGQRDIHIGQDLRIEQGAVQLAMRVVHAQTLAQGIQELRCPGWRSRAIIKVSTTVARSTMRP